MGNKAANLAKMKSPLIKGQLMNTTETEGGTDWT